MTISFRLLHENAVMPKRATRGSSGFDLVAVAERLIRPGEITVVPTGVAINLTDGFEAQVRSRSGLAKKGVIVLNSPGTIDSDYIGEIKIILHNVSRYPYRVAAGNRVAQLVIAPVYMGIVELSTEFVATKRGDGCFGSTGE